MLDYQIYVITAKTCVSPDILINFPISVSALAPKMENLSSNDCTKAAQGFSFVTSQNYFNAPVLQGTLNYLSFSLKIQMIETEKFSKNLNLTLKLLQKSR